ncbi:hypothetical protein [Paludisphaera soli]|uniref:hypothetical protein n=1 Tax=Paludisphaera soli TaxID=2712865 RepID=UPI0013ED5A54|nr:hypothetical protein [Paludisphaera soli]
MSGDHLATYLTDHMAGSTAALELLERLKAEYEGDPVAATATRLIAEIGDERKVLDGLAERIGASVTLPRKAASWITEKAAQLKLLYDDPKGGPLRHLESFEALSLGIEGKRLLWRALATASARRRELVGPDYDGLVAQAEDQRRRVEAHRLAAAAEALTGRPESPSA